MNAGLLAIGGISQFRKNQRFSLAETLVLKRKAAR
jgi:hypothetical protein